MINPMAVIERLTRRQVRATTEGPRRAEAFAKAKRVAGGPPRNRGSRQQRRRATFVMELWSAGSYDLPRRARRRIARARAKRLE